MQPWGIIGSEVRRLPARYLRRDFAVEKNGARWLMSAGMDFLSYLYLNGQKISDDVFRQGVFGNVEIVSYYSG
jgi:hypothetical protein